MNSETMHQHCWDLARDLLRGLERRDLALIEQRLVPLRQTLAMGRCLNRPAPDQDLLLRMEQLDLLEGITASVEASIEAIRGATQTHQARMSTAESLLRHLVEGGRRQSLPVC
jgi:hypothetical protein